MAANILRSPRAMEVSVFVIRAFVKMREKLSANSAILRRLAEIDRTLLLHDGALQELFVSETPAVAFSAGFARETQDRISSRPSLIGRDLVGAPGGAPRRPAAGGGISFCSRLRARGSA